MLKLRMARKPDAVSEFLRAFWADTYQNPFNPHERVWRMKVKITLSPFQDYIWLSAVESIKPKLGHGSECMDWLLDLVIEHGVLIKGNAQPFGPNRMEEWKLVQWYAECGFNTNGTEIYFDGEDK